MVGTVADSTRAANTVVDIAVVANIVADNTRRVANSVAANTVADVNSVAAAVVVAVADHSIE